MYLEIARTRDNIVVEKIFHSIVAGDALENKQLEIFINDLAYKLIFTLSEKQGTHITGVAFSYLQKLWSGKALHIM